MNSIRETIKELSDPTDEELEEICSALTPRELAKGQYLLSEGYVCRHYYFLEQGTLRLFYNKGINEYTVWMGTPGEVFTNLESYLSEESSKINIKAIEPS
ncbi:MAG: cyclic nucleotide-binding domain-containing protein, partial [Bacteroidota bacterium]